MAAVDSLHFWGLPEGPEGFDITHGGDAGEAIGPWMAGTMIFGKCGPTPQKPPKLSRDSIYITPIP
jgi:hypothetical protein